MALEIVKFKRFLLNLIAMRFKKQKLRAKTFDLKYVDAFASPELPLSRDTSEIKIIMN